MHSAADAARLILEHVRPLEPQRTPLKNALGRVLAEDVVSPIDLPPWDNASMDGYACRAADLSGSLIELRVIESVAAGAVPTKVVGPREATRIFTGAPLPQGADTVIRQEDTLPLPNDRVVIGNLRDLSRNVRRRGEDISRGATVLTAGAELGPAQLGVLASIVHGNPLTHSAPRVAFLTSGNEIAELGQKQAILKGKRIANANAYTLDGQIRAAGGTPKNLGIARDTAKSLRERLAKARGADAIITSGGVSVGEHDLVREVIGALGGTVDLWRVRIRPGGPFGFGELHGVPWFGLPGNPVSSMVTFELFVRPALRRLQGRALPFRRTQTVRVAEPVSLGPKLRHFLRAHVTPESNGLVARLTGPQGSGILTSMALANALLIVPENRPAVAAGDFLQAILLDDPQHVAAPPYES
jgi:molybdopterin molybdotransferase